MDAIGTPSLLPTRMLGVVDRVGTEWIGTEFYSALLPLWPRDTFYRTKMRDGEIRVVRIDRQVRSVVLGYLRTPLWLASLILAAPAFAEPRRWSMLYAIAIPLALIAALLTFAVGRLSATERARRELLRRVVGFGAPPELLPDKLATEIRNMLGEEWAAVSDAPWHEAITNGTPSELLVALAEYHGRHALAARARENLVARA